MNIALWVVQGLLVLMFLFTGLSKTFLPLPTVKKNFPLGEPRRWLAVLGDEFLVVV